MTVSHYNIFDPAVRANPYGVYASLREEGAVFQNPMLGMWMANGYDDVQQVLRDYAHLSSEWIGLGELGEVLKAPTMLFSDPPTHERLRQVVAPMFTTRAVSAMSERITVVTSELLDGLRLGEPFDIVGELAYPLPVIVIAEMLGVPPGDRDRFKEWSDAVIGFNGMADPESTARNRLEVEALVYYLQEQIAYRTKHPGDDLISRLIAANESGTVSEAELLAACVLLLVAGNETTTNLLANMVLAFTRFPAQYRLVRENPSLIPNAVEEALRFDPPVQAVPRLAVKEVTIHGVVIPEGHMVFAMNAGANRDPSVFENPNVFDIARENASKHLSFGFGIHSCIGASLARIEARIMLELLVERVESFSLAAPDEDLQYGPNFFLRGLTDLKVVAR